MHSFHHRNWPLKSSFGIGIQLELFSNHEIINSKLFGARWLFQGRYFQFEILELVCERVLMQQKILHPAAVNIYQKIQREEFSPIYLNCMSPPLCKGNPTPTTAEHKVQYINFGCLKLLVKIASCSQHYLAKPCNFLCFLTKRGKQGPLIGHKKGSL